MRNVPFARQRRGMFGAALVGKDCAELPHYGRCKDLTPGARHRRHAGTPTAALLSQPPRPLRDRPWTRAGMGGRIASRLLLCYPFFLLDLQPSALPVRPWAGGGRHPSAFTPVPPWRHDDGCPLQEASPRGSPLTRGGPGAPPAALGIRRATVAP